MLADVVLVRRVFISEKLHGLCYRSARVPCITGLQVSLRRDLDPLTVECFTWDSIDGVLYAELEDCIYSAGELDEAEHAAQWDFETRGWEVEPMSEGQGPRWYRKTPE
jgi:hypothetical protein